MSDVATVPERGFDFLGGEVRRRRQFERAEVEAALATYQDVAARAAATGDWGPWADLFTDDAVYVEHHHGVLRGRDAIRDWIATTMTGPTLDLTFPVLWHVVDGDLVVLYCPNRFAAPDGGDPYQFVCATVLLYAGDGRWCYEEDIYNVAEAARVSELFQRARGGVR